MTRYVGALDQGTSSTRFVIFDQAGRQAAIDVLERNGFSVIVPAQVCCGLPLISNWLYGQAQP